MHKTIFCRQSSVYSVDSASKTFNLAWFPVWKPFCETKQETLARCYGNFFFCKCCGDTTTNLYQIIVHKQLKKKKDLTSGTTRQFFMWVKKIK